MGKLLLLFILVPAVELALLIELGARIGTLPTLAIIAVTGILGASLARMQGLSVLRQTQLRLARGELPADSLADGAMILVAGALLMTPGILTDAFGFLLLVPAFRGLVKGMLWARFRKAVDESRLQVQVRGPGWSDSSGPVYDIRPEPPEAAQDEP